MQYVLHTEMDINAPLVLVWEVLTDLDRFADWNLFIVSSVGKVEIGENLVDALRSPGERS